MSPRAHRARPSQLGRAILRRVFDGTHAKPRPHLFFPPAPTEPPANGKSGS